MRQENPGAQQNQNSYSKRNHRAHHVARPNIGFRHTSRSSKRKIGQIPELSARGRRRVRLHHGTMAFLQSGQLVQIKPRARQRSSDRAARRSPGGAFSYLCAGKVRRRIRRLFRARVFNNARTATRNLDLPPAIGVTPISSPALPTA